MTINSICNSIYNLPLDNGGTLGFDFLYLGSALKSDMPSNPQWDLTATFDPNSTVVPDTAMETPDHIVVAPLVWGVRSPQFLNNDGASTVLPETYIGQHGATSAHTLFDKGIGLIAGNNLDGSNHNGLFGEIWLGSETDRYLYVNDCKDCHGGLADGHMTKSRTYAVHASVKVVGSQLWVTGYLWEDNILVQEYLGLGWPLFNYTSLPSSTVLRGGIGKNPFNDPNFSFFNTFNYQAASTTVWG